MNERPLRNSRSPWLHAVLAALALLAGPALAETWFLRGGTLWSDGRGYVQDAGVLIRDDKIEAVGRDLAPPAGARQLDLRQCFILPGLVEAHSQTGLHGDGVAWDTDEDTRPLTPELHAIDGFYPWAADVEAARRSGITTLLVTPAGKNLIGGSGVIVKTSAWGGANVVRQPAALKMSLGEEPKRDASMPKTRMGELALLRDHFRQVHAYLLQRQQARESGKEIPNHPELETTAALLRREIPAVIQVYGAKDISNALRLSEEMGFDAILAYATEAHLLADELAKRHVPVVLTAMKGLWFRLEKESFDARNAAQLLSAGVRIAVQTGEGNPYGNGDLLFNAGHLLKYELSEEDALRSVTSWPAQILRSSDRLGRIEPGLDADIAVLSGPPFDPKSKVLYVFIDGRLAFGDDDHR